MRNQSIRHRIVLQRRLILALRNHDICHKPLDRMLNVEASVHTLLCLPHAFNPGPMGSKWIQVVTMAPWLVLIALDYAAPYIFPYFPYFSIFFHVQAKKKQYWTGACPCFFFVHYTASTPKNNTKLEFITGTIYKLNL